MLLPPYAVINTSRLCLHQDRLLEVSVISRNIPSKHRSQIDKKLSSQKLRHALPFFPLSDLGIPLFPLHTHGRKQTAGLPVHIKVKEEKLRHEGRGREGTSHACRFSLRTRGEMPQRQCPSPCISTRPYWNLTRTPPDPCKQQKKHACLRHLSPRPWQVPEEATAWTGSA